MAEPVSGIQWMRSIRDKVALDLEGNSRSWGTYVNCRQVLDRIGAPDDLIIEVVELASWNFARVVIESDDENLHSHNVPKSIAIGPKDWSNYEKLGLIPPVTDRLVKLCCIWYEVFEQWQMLSIACDYLGNTELAKTYAKRDSHWGQNTAFPRKNEYWDAVKAFREDFGAKLPTITEFHERRVSLAQKIRELLPPS